MIQLCDPYTFSENGGATLRPCIRRKRRKSTAAPAYYQLPHHLSRRGACELVARFLGCVA